MVSVQGRPRFNASAYSVENSRALVRYSDRILGVWLLSGLDQPARVCLGGSSLPTNGFTDIAQNQQNRHYFAALAMTIPRVHTASADYLVTARHLI